jgi:hypothetical protein
VPDEKGESSTDDNAKPGGGRRGIVARFFDATMSGYEDPTALGLFRIVVVSILFLSHFGHVGSVAEYFSHDAWVGGRFAETAYPSRWSLFFSLSDPWAVRAIWGVGVVGHVCWILGYRTRIASVVAMFSWTCMYGRNPLLYAFPDQYGHAIGLLLMLTPSGNGLSLDARRRGSKPVPIWCRRILQLQLAVMYTATGFEKSADAWTKDGTALYYTLVNPYNRHWDIGRFLAQIQPWVLKPATFAVLMWEVGFAGFVVVHWIKESIGKWGRRIPDLRWLFLGFGFGVHLTIQLGLYVVFFSILTVLTYASFLRPEEAKRLLAWLGRRVAKLRRREPP